MNLNFHQLELFSWFLHTSILPSCPTCFKYFFVINCNWWQEDARNCQLDISL